MLIYELTSDLMKFPNDAHMLLSRTLIHFLPPSQQYCNQRSEKVIRRIAVYCCTAMSVCSRSSRMFLCIWHWLCVGTTPESHNSLEVIWPTHNPAIAAIKGSRYIHFMMSQKVVSYCSWWLAIEKYHTHYTTGCWYTTRKVITTALFCWHWIYPLGQSGNSEVVPSL